MTDIKRYEFSAHCQDGHYGLYAYYEYEQYQDGDWVKYDDIEEIIKENKRLREIIRKAEQEKSSPRSHHNNRQSVCTMPQGHPSHCGCHW